MVTCVRSPAYFRRNPPASRFGAARRYPRSARKSKCLRANRSIESSVERAARTMAAASGASVSAPADFGNGMAGLQIPRPDSLPHAKLPLCLLYRERRTHVGDLQDNVDRALGCVSYGRLDVDVVPLPSAVSDIAQEEVQPVIQFRATELEAQRIFSRTATARFSRGSDSSSRISRRNDGLSSVTMSRETRPSLRRQSPSVHSCMAASSKLTVSSSDCTCFVRRIWIGSWRVRSVASLI